MKAGNEHRVPLISDRAVEILKGLPWEDDNDFIFIGGRAGEPISDMAMAELLKGMGYGSDRATVHGFRSTFRDWASEQTSFPHQTCEHALAHRISDKAEAASREQAPRLYRLCEG